MTTVPIRGKVRGRFRWEVLDADGEVERTGPWQENIITDQGLNHLCNTNPARYNAFGTIRDTLHVGDGSTPPAASDVALANQVGTAGYATIDTYTRSTVESAGTVTGTITVRHTYTAAGPENLSEIGYSPDGGATNLGIRQLIRDGGGTPITVSLLAGKKLRVTHELILTAAQSTPVVLTVEEYDTGNNLVASPTYAGDLYLTHDSGSTQGGADNAHSVWGDPATSVAGAGGNQMYVWLGSAPPPPVWDADTPSGDDNSDEGIANANPSLGVRRRYATLTELEGNGDIYAYALSITDFGQMSGGPLVILDTPITKANTHTLRLGWTWTWTRA